MKHEIGLVKTYIRDYPEFQHLTDIPVEAAIEWVKKICPSKTIGSYTECKDMTIKNVRKSWNNKYWIIVSCEHETWIALENHDDDFSIYTKPFESSDLVEDD